MIVLQDNFDSKLSFKTYIALGSFDGLHIGHMSLINKTLELSKHNKVKSMVYTFNNHPLSIINKDKVPKLLMDNESKLNILDKIGIDIVNLVDFNIDYMKIVPEQFVMNMLEFYNAAGIIVGFNYKFGYKNAGDVSLLEKLSKRLNFELIVMDSVMYNDNVISSSRIRNLISDGNVAEANKMLFQPFMLKGKVIKGKQLGRKLGFPTVNLQYNTEFILPATGVYYTTIEYNGIFYKGITSVGYNPTVEPINIKISIETYILDFNKNIYDENIKVYFIEKMRDEIKFDSLDDLIRQLEKDKFYAESQVLQKID
ncbi:bifunctional riboflavin kinase/FAD synthetase [Clostridium sp. YIM B02515]|uniref:Riboflavin biosynthesis protein n=1 Tax=Clostridium rhizosphaerae TaxID=2803861 RepID=A0ABS1T6B8_9CLOT|nr:bifunctional riboflavin kinase/FAD synthetase [Clostridium rhizosphaerae]MBL4934889.1 bifunctional riboflavin kinase/FAD synthetase [Clostridium rhizosphaerae]